MTRRLTHEQFIERLYERNKNAENIEVLGEYINNKTPIECKCKIDGYKWSPKPNDLLNNHGCPMCSGVAKKTHEQFIKELSEINSDIEVLGEYINNKTPIECKCKIDGYKWCSTPNRLLSGQGCPMCYNERRGENRRKTHEQFIKELSEINSDIEILGEYVNNQTKIECRCRIDGCEWSSIPKNLLKGAGCPKCNTSKGEKAITKYLEEHNISFKDQHRFDDCKFYKELPFDFYIPSLNIVIEYDGSQHYEIFKYFGGLEKFIDIKIRDTIKTIYCEENNIRLIRIPYWELDNIENILDKIFLKSIDKR